MAAHDLMRRLFQRFCGRTAPRCRSEDQDEGRVPQSAVLAYRWRQREPEVILVTSRSTRRWVLPKGNLEPGMTPAESAAKEAFEEAGVLGTTDARCISTYTYVKADESAGRRRCHVQVFPMLVQTVCEDWPERKQRDRVWMTPEQAARRVDESELKALLIDFRRHLQ